MARKNSEGISRRDYELTLKSAETLGKAQGFLMGAFTMGFLVAAFRALNEVRSKGSGNG